VVKELADLYAQAEQRYGADLSGAKAAVAEHAAAAEAAKVALEATTNRVSKLLEDKEAKNAAYETATDGVKTAKEKLEAEQAKAASIASDKASVESKQSEFDQVMQGDFKKLKNSEFPNKDWRARNKTITRVLEHFGHADVCQALLDALPVALKTAAADRGKFALAAVEHAEAAVKDYMEKMTAAITAFNSPLAQQAKEVSDAEQAVAAAELVGKTAWQEMVDAENAWVEEQGRKDDETATVNSAAPKAKALEESVEEASRALERFNGLRAQFVALADHAAPQPEVADASPAPEAPMEVAAPEPVPAA
jgi:chromosome segregation ATPase